MTRQSVAIVCLLLCAACGKNENNANPNNASPNNANNTNSATNGADTGMTTQDMAGSPDMGSGDVGADMNAADQGGADMGPSLDEAAANVRDSAADARTRATSGSLADRLDLMLFAARAESALGDDMDTQGEGLMPLVYTWDRTKMQLRLDSNERAIESLERLKRRRMGTPEEGEFDQQLSDQQLLQEKLLERQTMMSGMDTDPTTTESRFRQRATLTHYGQPDTTVKTQLSSAVQSLSFRVSCQQGASGRWDNLQNEADSTDWSLTIGGLSPMLTVSQAVPQVMGSLSTTGDITEVRLTSGSMPQGQVECVFDLVGLDQEVTKLTVLTQTQDQQIEAQGDVFRQRRIELYNQMHADLDSSSAPTEDQQAIVDSLIDLMEEASESVSSISSPLPGQQIEDSRLRDTSMRVKLFRRSAQAVDDTLPADYDGTDESLRAMIRATLRLGALAKDASEPGSSDVVTVNYDTGTGSGSLQSLANSVDPGTTLIFAPTVTTISQAEGGPQFAAPIVVSRPLTIVGDPVNRTTIMGESLTGVFVIDTPGEVVTMQNLVITTGRAQMGGGIFVKAGTLILENSGLTSNTAMGDGGAIYVAPGATAILNGVSMYGNSAQRGGGTYGDVTCTRCWIDTNTAVSTGGGMMNPTFVQNSAFNGNSGASGGAIAYGAGSGTLSYNTFNNNSATTMAGAVLIAAGGQVEMYANNLNASNTAPMAPAVRNQGTLTASFNVVADASGATALAMSPNIIATGDTTGSALVPLGDALNAVTDADCAERAASQDFNGVARPSGGPCDAGAFEVTDCTDNCNANGICVMSTCFCSVGWYGATCNQELTDL